MLVPIRLCVDIYSLFVASLVSGGCEGEGAGRVRVKQGRGEKESFILITVQRYTITSIDCTAWLAMGMIYGNVGNNQPITPQSTTPSYFGFSRLHITHY